jgi:hypothetical protein
LFGQAIVRTPNDFGIYGQRPTHPRLLDHLASRLIQSGWSIKSLIREIVTSRTYQLTSLVSPDEFERDPDNRLLARHDRRRLDAESLRDSMLRASGHLNLARPDGSIIQHRDILVNLAGSLHQPSNHRSVYLCYLRSSPPPELAAFDLPDFTTVVGQRETSTVPSQSLHLFNSSFVMEQADRLGRVLCSRHRDSRQRVVAAFRAALQRQPSDSEIAASLQWLQSAKQRLDCERELWTSFSQMLLMTNEFRYVD